MDFRQIIEWITLAGSAVGGITAVYLFLSGTFGWPKTVDKRLDELEKKVDRLDVKIDKNTDNLRKELMEHMDRRIDNTESKLMEHMDRRIDNTESKLMEHMDRRFDSLLNSLLVRDSVKGIAKDVADELESRKKTSN